MNGLTPWMFDDDDDDDGQVLILLQHQFMRHSCSNPEWLKLMWCVTETVEHRMDVDSWYSSLNDDVLY
jgi:hypothetical protein